MKLTFLDVGNKDSIVILSPEVSCILIDVPDYRYVDKYLSKNNISIINSIYFTHDHRDHLPTFTTLVTFLENWIQKGSIERVFIPVDYLNDVLNNIKDDDNDMIRHSFDKLDLMDKKGSIKIVRSEKGSGDISFEKMKISIIHPRFLFSIRNTGNNMNEKSLVIKVEYSNFSTLLLADLDNNGMKDLLSVCTDDILKCNIIKIPHHGAWPKNDDYLRELLSKSDPELAILSVGSKNPYGHVDPNLFLELISIKNNTSRKMKNFICTEVTRTCLCSREERNDMNKQGLDRKISCAGDIEILIDDSGVWNFQSENEHNNTIQGITRAACQGKADISFI